MFVENYIDDDDNDKRCLLIVMLMMMMTMTTDVDLLLVLPLLVYIPFIAPCLSKGDGNAAVAVL
jgi:hypothetical protein